jgi:hypothetical protein
MTNFFYSLLQEPRQDLYYKLLDYSLNKCKFALLVTRYPIKLSTSGKNLLGYLENNLIEKNDSSEWPGTILFNETATIYKYKYTREFIEIIKRFSSSLYEWEQPQLPEDLCLLRDDREHWLVTIAHDKDAYFYCSENELFDLLKFLPELETTITRDKPEDSI